LENRIRILEEENRKLRAKIATLENSANSFLPKGTDSVHEDITWNARTRSGG
jgi:hypothetical protein